jgi:hypothetical protein
MAILPLFAATSSSQTKLIRSSHNINCHGSFGKLGESLAETVQSKKGSGALVGIEASLAAFTESCPLGASYHKDAERLASNSLAQVLLQVGENMKTKARLENPESTFKSWLEELSGKFTHSDENFQSALQSAIGSILHIDSMQPRNAAGSPSQSSAFAR